MNDERDDSTRTDGRSTDPPEFDERIRARDDQAWRTVAETEFDRSAGAELGTAVAAAIAEAADAPPESLEPPLYECVDAELLEKALFDADRSQEAASARFRYCDHLVTAHGDGAILIAERADENRDDAR